MSKKDLSFAEEIEALTPDEKEIERTLARLDANKKKLMAKKEEQKLESTKSSTPPKKTVAKKKSVAQPSWSEPTASLNTRIPPEMSRLLDDLVYQRKKADRKVSKQQIVIAAIEDALAKFRLIGAAE